LDQILTELYSLTLYNVNALWYNTDKVTVNGLTVSPLTREIAGK